MLVSMSPSEEKKFQSLLTFSGGGGHGTKEAAGKDSNRRGFSSKTFLSLSPNAIVITVRIIRFCYFF